LYNKELFVCYHKGMYSLKNCILSVETNTKNVAKKVD